MQKFILILIYLTLGTFINGQNRSLGTLSMVQRPNPSGAVTRSSVDSVKYKKALKVYNKLVEARGDLRYPVPNLIMSKSEDAVASMDYKKMTIDLEEKAFDVCSKFGDDAQVEAAIAFLLGHELTHYYEKHAWKRGFVADFKDLNIGLKLDSIQDDVAKETEADYLGGFLSYTAGYGFFDKTGDVIQALYKDYGLPEIMVKYPSLSDRKKMSARTLEKLKELIQVFDMANLLTAIGNYSEAYEYYRYVLQDYQSREIYNNLGVTALLDAIQYFNAGELKFRYPIQLDLQASSRGDGFATIRETLIKQALLHFDAAISLDPNYAPAYLNKACAYALLGDLDRAQFYGDKEARSIARKTKQAKTLVDVDILMGIIEATNGHTDKAKKLFQSAADQNSGLAKINLKILNNEDLGSESETFGGFAKKELIDGQHLKSLVLENEFSNVKSLVIGNRITFSKVNEQGPNSFLFVGENEKTDKRVFFHGTNPNYSGESGRKIKIGSDFKAVTDAYGNPKTTIETPVGQILVYKSIIFILGNQGKVDRWLIYEKE
ncbi:MAG: tetratricopeptide repeat protein [Saprospiraceae bacterium]|nr:tetratricopeptide repeat protein [Candidatus Defluviibacterium haderslevense]